MAKDVKSVKSEKKKRNASYKIDPDLYEKAMEKCHQESIATKSRVTLSGVIEEYIKSWVNKK